MILEILTMSNKELCQSKSQELLTFAYLHMTVCQKANGTEISTFYLQVQGPF